jgi:Protease subunit of ATP-dependent Clp proteases
LLKKQNNYALGVDGETLSPNIFAKASQFMEYTIHFSQEFSHPSHYDEVVSLLMTAEEGDVINMMINNFGGRVDALNSILNAMSMTHATVNGFLIGQGCSCASVLFLACHNWVVGDNVTLMIHEQSFFVGGKASETKKQHEHYQKQNERFIRDTYKNFLTDEEIDQVLKGQDFYFEDYEINERLKNRNEIITTTSLEDLDQQGQDAIDSLSDEEISEEIKILQGVLRQRKKEQRELEKPIEQ